MPNEKSGHLSDMPPKGDTATNIYSGSVPEILPDPVMHFEATTSK